MNPGPGGRNSSFDALEDQMDQLEQRGVPDDWATAFKRLRSELKNVRTRWSPFEQTFGRMDPADAEQFLEAANAWGEGNRDGVARWMFEVSRAISEPAQWQEWMGTDGGPNESGGTPANGEDQDMGEITEETLQEAVAKAVAEALAADRERAREETEKEREAREFRERVESKLRDLGYEDPSSPEAAAVLLRAKDMDGDPFESIDQAHEQFQTFILDRAKKYAAEKSADAGATEPPVGDANGEKDPNEGYQPDESVSDPEELMRNRLDAVFGDGDTSVLT